MSPDGSGDQSFASVSNNFVAITINPAVTSQVVFAYQSSPSAKIGLYSNTTASMTGATQIVAPVFSSINSLQVTGDGQTVVFVANSLTSAGKLMRVAIDGTGGPIFLDSAESANVNPAGTQVAYAKAAANNVLVLTVNGLNPGDSATQLTTDTYDCSYPQFSKDGTTIVFSSDLGTDGSYDLYTIPAVGGSLTRLTNTAATDELGASFNDDGTQVSCVVLALDSSKSGIYRENTSGVGVGRIQLKSVPNPGDLTYWTSAGGRSLGSPMASLESRMRRRQRRSN